MAVVVEFMGIPGAGKSTLGRAIAAELEARGHTVLGSPRPSARTKVLAAIRSRRFVVFAVRVMVRSPRPWRERFAALRFLAVTIERYQAAFADQSNTVYLFDEGSLQRSFMFLVEADGVRRDQLATYVDRAPLADVIVHVDAPAPDAHGRLKLRDRKLPDRLAGLDDDDASALLAEAALMFVEAGSLAVARPSRAQFPTRLRIGPVTSDETDLVMAELAALL